MIIKNATKKLEKAGFKIEKIASLFQASHPSTNYVIEFFKNGREDYATCINVRRRDDNHDGQSDYCAGAWANNITQAIKMALR